MNKQHLAKKQKTDKEEKEEEDDDDDDDMQIIEAKKAMCCPLSLCIMKVIERSSSIINY